MAADGGGGGRVPGGRPALCCAPGSSAAAIKERTGGGRRTRRRVASPLSAVAHTPLPCPLPCPAARQVCGLPRHLHQQLAVCAGWGGREAPVFLCRQASPCCSGCRSALGLPPSCPLLARHAPLPPNLSFTPPSPIWCRNHPGDPGHKVLAEALAAPLLRAAGEVQAQRLLPPDVLAALLLPAVGEGSGGEGGSYSRQDPRVPELPPPMLPGSHERRTIMCAMQVRWLEGGCREGQQPGLAFSCTREAACTQKPAMRCCLTTTHPGRAAGGLQAACQGEQRVPVPRRTPQRHGCRAAEVGVVGLHPRCAAWQPKLLFPAGGGQAAAAKHAHLLLPAFVCPWGSISRGLPCTPPLRWHAMQETGWSFRSTREQMRPTPAQPAARLWWRLVICAATRCGGAVARQTAQAGG